MAASASHPRSTRLVRKFVQRIQADLKRNADDEQAQRIANYMRKSPPTLYHGLLTPERRRVQAAVMKDFPDLIRSQESYETAIETLWKLRYREEKHAAIDLALANKDYIGMQSLALYESMLRADWCWWDFADPIAINLVGKVALDDWDLMLPVLTQWIQDDNRWIRRTAILAQLKHKSRTHEDVLWDFILQRCDEKEFFIRKAIGWALREYGKTNPLQVKQFLLENKSRLSNLSYREGSRILVKDGVMQSTT